MPYFIFRTQPFAMPQKLQEHPDFASASAQAKQLRAALPAHAREGIKLMFAESQTQAEDLLCQIRDAGPTGDE